MGKKTQYTVYVNDVQATHNMIQQWLKNQFYGWAVTLVYQEHLQELFRLLQVQQPKSQTIEVK